MDWILCVIYYPIRENTSTVLEKRKNDWRIDMELTINDLSKEYGRKKAVNHFSAKLTNGVYGLLGANGAGKTTLMRMICDVQTETKGAIFFNGKNIHDLGEKYRNILGYLPQNFGYYQDFTAYDFLSYIGVLKGLEGKKLEHRIEYLLKELGLYEKKNIRLKLYSGGMLRRVGIAQALLNEPEILILDEPTAGLDPKERIHLKNLLNQYGEKHTVIISTHIVSDVEDISQAIILLKKGEICEQGDLDVLLKKIEGFVYEGTVPKTQLDYFMNKYRVRNVYDLGNTIRIRIITEDNVEKCFAPIEATLNDLYLYYFDEVSEDD